MCGPFSERIIHQHENHFQTDDFVQYCKQGSTLQSNHKQRKAFCSSRAIQSATKTYTPS